MKRRSGWRTLKISMAGSMKRVSVISGSARTIASNAPEVAGEVAGFFFGDETKENILSKRMTILPECTGVWWLRV